MKELAAFLFKIRSYTPIPFLLLMFIFYSGNMESWLVGIPIIIFGEFIRFWGVANAGCLTRTTNQPKAKILVTSGPFGYVRNPLYIGNIIVYTGFGILSYALFPYLAVIAFFWFIFQYWLIISIEEKFLESKFGLEYEQYKENVNRLWPRFTPYNSGGDQATKPNYKKGLRSELRTIQALVSVTLITAIIHWVKYFVG